MEQKDKNTAKEYVGSDEIYDHVQHTRKLTAQLNSGYKTENEVREYLTEITGKPTDVTSRLFPPVYINYGRGLTLGKEIFINFGCTFLSLGGITVEDGVFIGPDCVIASEYHPENPETRHSLLTKPIVIKKNVWLGAGVKVLAGVTIGENSVIAAGSTVTKDIPANVIAVGSPAKVLREIKTNDSQREI